MTPTAPTFCGRCGAPLQSGQPFCGRCGAPVFAAVPTTYPLAAPVAFAATAQPPRSKLAHRQTLLIAGSVVVVLVVVLTFVAVKLFASPTACGFYCGPHTGPRLAGAVSYQNTKWGFVIDYSTDNLKIQNADPTSDSVTFAGLDSHGNTKGSITFTARQGVSTQQAVQDALANDYPDSKFSELQQVEPVPGAEIGLIPGDGVGYSASLASSTGSSKTPVSIIVMASQHGSTTIVASMWSVSITKSGDPPFYMGLDTVFDQPITQLHFAGG